MVNFYWTGFSILAMFIYAIICFMIVGVVFNWKIAMGIILFLFFLEIVASLVDNFLERH